MFPDSYSCLCPVGYFFNRKKTQQFVSVPMLQANLEDKHIRTGLSRPNIAKEVGRGEIDRNARTKRNPQGTLRFHSSVTFSKFNLLNNILLLLQMKK